MVSTFFLPVGAVGLLWLCCMLHSAWPSSHAAGVPSTQAIPPSRKRPRSRALPAIPASPHCRPVRRQLCRAHRLPAPHHSASSPRGPPGQVDTSSHFCRSPTWPIGAGGAGQSQCQRASEWWPLAAIRREAKQSRGDRYLWIELIHPIREGQPAADRSQRSLNHRWIVGGKLCLLLNQWG